VKSRCRNKRLAPVWAAALVLLCCPSLTGWTAAAYCLGVATMVDDMKVRQWSRLDQAARE